MHLTGEYPDWWSGRRFNHPILAWAGSNTNVTTRDILEEKLFGPKPAPGTGWIREELIGKPTGSRNISDALERCEVKHKSGGWSVVVFKSYSQGDDKWQGKPVHVIHLDEEPDEEIWAEAIARITATDGLIMLTFTPKRGLSAVVREFYPKCNNDEKYYVRMELDEAMHEDGTSHLTEEARDKIRNRYHPHQQAARLKGLPQLGSGLIYPIDEERIIEPIVEPGRNWRHIGGLDLGGGASATAFAWLALDPMTEVVHLIHTYKHIDPKISTHAAAIRAVAPQVPVSWPHDARIKGTTGETRKFEYQKHGVRMLEKPARFPDLMGGSNSVEDGISVIYNMMEEGRFRAAAHLTDFWDEFRTYHRQNGIINKADDHILDAIRYAIMGLNFAQKIGSRMKLPTRMPGKYNPLKPDQHRKLNSSSYLQDPFDDFGDGPDYPTRVN